MGRIEKGVTCSISGCTERAVRSVSSALAEKAKLKVETTRHVYLCQTHYREFKKRTQKDKKLERLRWKAES